MLSKNNIEKILDEILEEDEQVCWEGKPEIKSRVLSIFVNLNLGAVVGIKILGILCGDMSDVVDLIFKVLFLLSLVWYVYCAVRGILEYTNTYYLITNKGVYRCGGDLKQITEDVQFKNAGFVQSYQGIIDGIMGTGSVFFSDALEETAAPGEQGFSMKMQRGSLKGIYFLNIEEYDIVESIGNTNLDMAEKQVDKTAERKQAVINEEVEKPEEPKVEERPKTLDERRAEFLR